MKSKTQSIFKKLKHKKNLVFTIFFITTIFLGWLGGANSLIPFLYTDRIIVYIFFFWLLYTLKLFSYRELRTLILASSGLLLIFGFIQYLVFPDAYHMQFLGWDDHYRRLFSTYFDPAFVSIIFVMTINFMIIEILETYRHLIPKLIAITAFLSGLFLTYSRSAFLALGISL
ncbi:MAG: hypothetical protein LBG64_02840, partial [Pseudomonadales bacterium]|nr:hypothetical protein [Pseudomonadales bacterium]